MYYIEGLIQTSLPVFIDLVMVCETCVLLNLPSCHLNFPLVWTSMAIVKFVLPQAFLVSTDQYVSIDHFDLLKNLPLAAFADDLNFLMAKENLIT